MSLLNWMSNSIQVQNANQDIQIHKYNNTWGGFATIS